MPITYENFSVNKLDVDSDNDITYDDKPFTYTLDIKKVVYKGADKFKKGRFTYILSIDKMDYKIIKKIEDDCGVVKSIVDSKKNGEYTNYSLFVKTKNNLKEGKINLKISKIWVFDEKTGIMVSV